MTPFWFASLSLKQHVCRLNKFNRMILLGGTVWFRVPVFVARWQEERDSAHHGEDIGGETVWLFSLRIIFCVHVLHSPVGKRKNRNAAAYSTCIYECISEHWVGRLAPPHTCFTRASWFQLWTEARNLCADCQHVRLA